MRDDVREFVRIAASTFALKGPVYEFGAYLVDDQKEIADLRPLFPGKRYIGCDMRSGPGVDRVEDVTQLSLADAVASTVLCLDTLEHVFDPIRAVTEMTRVLAPGGVIVISAPLDFYVHDYPSDYWRLTPSCLARLLAPLDFSLVGWQGPDVHPHTVLGIGVKAPVPAHATRDALNLIEQFRGYLAERDAGQPWRTKLKHRLRSWAKSRHERRRRAEYFHCDFAMAFQSSANAKLAILESESHAEYVGGRIDL